jgi:hypothetical protein
MKTKSILFAGVSFFILCLAFLTFGHEVFAVAKYFPLEPIRGVSDGAGGVDVGNFISNSVKLIIQIAGALAVIMIVIGGVQYLSTDAINDKSEGKERIQNAIYGLILAFASFIILQTINPGTLQLDLTLQNINPVESVSGEPILGETPISSDIAICSEMTAEERAELEAEGEYCVENAESCLLMRWQCIGNNTCIRHDEQRQEIACADVPVNTPLCSNAMQYQTCYRKPGSTVAIPLCSTLPEVERSPGNNCYSESVPGTIVRRCSTKGGTIDCTCADCVDLAFDYSIPIKPGSNSFATRSLAEKLKNINNPGNTWQVTEGWPNTVVHASACHTDGNCVDINFTPAYGESALQKPTPEMVQKINRFFANARAAGLTPEFEVSSATTRTALLNAGVNAGYTIKVISAITAPHYSVYNR